ncbi:DUF397 domain-containing protein [Nocardiopsis sp. NPDC058789]|uniref:DUF397 domain-containing protein n=1 Tax=Nocardiopsis eucommiae TaxID=2831970 RepID=A0A975QIZ1_9ACTN|nr:DUF397 domain-containing protein [Nocardiopsis eucommiae]
MYPQAPPLTFRKSSYSNTARECVEVAHFRRATHGVCGDHRAEVTDPPSGAAVRDTRNRALSTLAFSSAEWAAFLRLA